jgi:hypothetical protein
MFTEPLPTLLILKIEVGLWGHLDVCLYITPYHLKAAIVEPEETAVTIPYNHSVICAMTPEGQNSAVREAPPWSFLGNCSVIRPFSSKVSALVY